MLFIGGSESLPTDGNRTRVDELPNLRAVVYKYDRLNRLTDEEILDPTNGDETISYTYDNFGNRITKTDAEKTIVYTYDGNDRLRHEIGPDHLVSYQYDDNGNTIEKSDGENITTYGYDQENRLVNAQNPEHYLEYQYDMDGIRVASSVDGVLTRYTVDKNRDYAQVLEERDADGNLIVSYVYGDDLISQNRNGVESWYHYDGQMSARQLTDSAGNVTDKYTYDAFGVLKNQTGDTVNNYMYAGEQYDPNVKFYYLRARWMSPKGGRFSSMDIWKGRIVHYISLNKYLYANSNPNMYNDPRGMISISAVWQSLPSLFSFAQNQAKSMFKIKSPFKIMSKCRDGEDPSSDEYSRISKHYPLLKLKEFRVTGGRDNSYNCFAYSLGIQRFPIIFHTMEVARAFYKAHHYEPTNKIESKVVLYGMSGGLFGNDAPKHAARKYTNCPGYFESKMGADIRILHEIVDLENGAYGQAIEFYDCMSGFSYNGTKCI